MRGSHLLRIASLAAVACLSLSACGGDNGGASESTVTQTVTEAAPPPDEESAPTQDEDLGGGGGSGGGKIRVPDVVGKDHQLAQDTMQAAGLYNLSEEDATGQGRVLIIDRNWTVVEQDPPAGTSVGEDATITLRSKKDGE